MVQNGDLPVVESLQKSPAKQAQDWEGSTGQGERERSPEWRPTDHPSADVELGSPPGTGGWSYMCPANVHISSTLHNFICLVIHDV